SEPCIFTIAPIGNRGIQELYTYFICAAGDSPKNLRTGCKPNLRIFSQMQGQHGKRNPRWGEMFEKCSKNVRKMFRFPRPTTDYCRYNDNVEVMHQNKETVHWKW